MSTAEGRPTRDATAGMSEIIKSQQMHQQGHQQHSVDTNMGFLRNMRKRHQNGKKVVKKGTKKSKNSPEAVQHEQEISNAGR